MKGTLYKNGPVMCIAVDLRINDLEPVFIGLTNYFPENTILITIQHTGQATVCNGLRECALTSGQNNKKNQELQFQTAAEFRIKL